MITGPKGQKRPAEVIGNAVKVMRIATGEDSVIDDGKAPVAKALGTKSSKKRAENTTPERQAEIAREAAENGGLVGYGIRSEYFLLNLIGMMVCSRRINGLGDAHG